MNISNKWKDYECMKTGNGEKLERWKNIILIRPDPQIIWSKKEKWNSFDGHYHRSKEGGGSWEFRKKLPEYWTVNYKDLTFTFRYPVNILIKDKTLLKEEERKYASHHNTHIDFLIYNKISKIPLLAVEVDGYKYHKEDNKQKERDILKNDILSKYNISLIRLTTNGSREESIIKSKLDEIVCNK